MALGIFEVREIVDRVFAQQDVLDACAKRGLGRVIMILGAQGLTQGRIAELTGISQGRLSEWAGRKRKPRASSVFEAFAYGLGLPAAAAIEALQSRRVAGSAVRRPVWKNLEFTGGPGTGKSLARASGANALSMYL